MKNLIEIARIVTKKKVKKIEIFDEYALRNKNSKFNDFYEALTGGKFKNDRDAATYLYGCSPTDDKYRQLKSRFRRRLLNTLFFLDVNLPSASNYERAHFTCQKEWTLINILRINNAHQTAHTMARHMLSRALKFKFADVIVNCSRLLREYAAREGDRKSFEEYNEHLQKYEEVLEAELRSEEIFQHVQLFYFGKKEDRDTKEELLEKYGQELLDINERFDTPVIFFNSYLVWTYRFEIMRNFKAMLEVCEKAEHHIEKNPKLYSSEKLDRFRLKKMSGYLHLRDFKTARQNAETYLQNSKEGSLIWYDFMEYYILTALHTENYIQALAIFNKAVSSTKFKKLNGIRREKWNLLEVYVNYIAEKKGDQNKLLRDLITKPFHLNKFLSEPQLYPRDLRTLSIHAMIGQVLFLLDKKNLNIVSETVDRIRNQATRYLKKDEQYRLLQFVRLLHQLNKAGFEQNKLSNTEKYLQRLKDRPFFYRGSIEEIEFIPFETLWDMILKDI